MAIKLAKEQASKDEELQHYQNLVSNIKEYTEKEQENSQSAANTGGFKSGGLFSSAQNSLSAKWSQAKPPTQSTPGVSSG